MKLFRKMRKRLAKKMIGRFWRKLNEAAKLKVGDLISTCYGHNERIMSITYKWVNFGNNANSLFYRALKGRYVDNILIETDGGFTRCAKYSITFPVETKIAIMNKLRNMPTNISYGERLEMLMKEIRNGKEILNDDGELLPEYRVGRI